MIPKSQPITNDRTTLFSRSTAKSSGTKANHAVNQYSNGGKARISKNAETTANSAFSQDGKSRKRPFSAMSSMVTDAIPQIIPADGFVHFRLFVDLAAAKPDGSRPLRPYDTFSVRLVFAKLTLTDGLSALNKICQARNDGICHYHQRRQSCAVKLRELLRQNGDTAAYCAGRTKTQVLAQINIGFKSGRARSVSTRLNIGRTTVGTLGR